MANDKIAELPANELNRFGTRLEIFKSVFAINRERVDRALAVSKTIQLKDGAEILDDAQDIFANDFLTKARITLEGSDKKKGVKEERLESTKVLDEAKAWAMGPEKELIAEMERVKRLRDIRANKKAAEAAEQQKEIEMQKAYEIYRSEVKSRMQKSYMEGVEKKLSDLQTAISNMFAAATLEKFTLEKSLNIKPSLKESYFDDLLTVPFDQSIMTVEQFDELKAKAKEYFSFEKVNAVYIDLANKIIAEWKEKIPFKRVELEKIAKGGAEAEKAKQKAQSDQAQLETKQKSEAAQRQADIDKAANDLASGGALEAEFKAQVQTQSIDEPAGRTITKYRIDPKIEADPMQLSTFIGKLILHVTMETEEGKRTFSIFKKTKTGETKVNADGQPEYIDGIQEWLDLMAKIKYTNTKLVPGLVEIKKISTTASVKK
jgi:hypothetical protein